MTSFLPRLVGVGSIKLIRSFHRSCRLGAFDTGSYEGDGKTTVTILNRDVEYGLMIDSISTAGFQLNNGITVLGPAIIFPKSVIGWNIESSNEINDDSLTLLKVLEPTPDLLIVGLDQSYKKDATFIKTLRTFAKKQDMSIEILPIEHACTTFNFLNAEHRYVVAALMPPQVQLPRGLQALNNTAIRRHLSIAEKQSMEK